MSVTGNVSIPGLGTSLEQKKPNYRYTLGKKNLKVLAFMLSYVTLFILVASIIFNADKKTLCL